MRRIKDREVVVEGDEMISVNDGQSQIQGQSATGARQNEATASVDRVDAKGKGWAVDLDLETNIESAKLPALASTASRHMVILSNLSEILDFILTLFRTEIPTSRRRRRGSEVRNVRRNANIVVS
jgi:hypothetical protein